MGDELSRYRLEQGVTGAMAMAVVDCLEAVEVDEHQRGLCAVALDVRKRALEFALEPAAVEDIEQRIDIGTRLQLPNARARNGNLALEPLDLGQQWSCWRKFVMCTVLRRAEEPMFQPLANLNLATENTPFALPAGSLNL